MAPTYPAIPTDAGQVKGWKSIPIKEVGFDDPLIPLGPLSKEANNLITSSLYFGEHHNSPYSKKENKLQGSLLTLFARRSTARRLLAAEQLLPKGCHLLLFDTYRPFEVQRSLYDFYKQKLSEKRPNMDNSALERETQRYVSLPSQDPSRPSPHSTGGVVDVAIIKLQPAHEEKLHHIRIQRMATDLSLAKQIDLEMQQSALLRHSKMLNFGTAFDHGGEKSALAYYEAKRATGASLTAEEEEACHNRRLLFDVMTEAGFEPYYAEWWHFNAPETQMGAVSAGHKKASFGAASLDESTIAHETMRLAVRGKALERYGDVAADGGSWPAEIIAPSKE